MRRRRVHHWVVWLLPLFAVRALIPVGFMLAPADGGLQLVLCSGQGALIAPPGSQQASAHQHHLSADAASEHARHSSGAGLHDNSICPFALAGMAALASACASPPQYLKRVIASYPAQADRLPFAQPHGLARIRGPPLV